MAMSKKVATTESLVRFCRYAERKGARVGEMHGFATVHRVHSANSFHYDKDGKYGQAADINYGAAGTSHAERDMLNHLIVVARSFGLSVIYAKYGTTGSASAHKTHLHVDVGSWSNLGSKSGAFRTTPGDGVVWETQPTIHAMQDNLSGDETVKRLNALREASNHGGVDFPYGVEFAQNVVDTIEDDVWGVNSRGAHDHTMVDLQKVWKSAGLYKGKIDGIWGPLMDNAFISFKNQF